LAAVNKQLMEELFRSGIMPEQPRGRTARKSAAAKMLETAAELRSFKKLNIEEAVGGVKYSGVVGGLAGLIEASVVTVNLR
jgi:hypothetical protein